MPHLCDRRWSQFSLLAIVAALLSVGCQDGSGTEKPELEKPDAVEIVRPADVDGGGAERRSLTAPRSDVRRFGDVDASPDPIRETDCGYGGSDNLACGVVELDSDGDTVCALVQTGRVVCWGEVHDPEKEGKIGDHDGTGPDDVWFVDVDVGDEHTCGVTWRGAARCWGDEMRGPPGRFTDVWGGAETTCARRKEGWTQCWGWAGVSSPDQPLRDIRFRDHDDPAWACGLDADGRITCWGKTDDTDPSPGAGYREFIILDEAFCGLTMSGDIECSGSPDFVEFSGPYRDIASDGSGAVCTVSADGTTECWSSRDENRLADEPSERMRSVTVEYDYACGITYEHEVECWGEDAPRPP